MSTKGPYATMAAAGTTLAGANEVVADIAMVTSGTGGVRLDALNVGEERVVINGINGTSAIDLNVYPVSGGSINNATASSPLVLPQNKAVRFKAIDGAGNVAAFF